jgi:hypothetical protein
MTAAPVCGRYIVDKREMPYSRTLVKSPIHLPLDVNI